MGSLLIPRWDIMLLNNQFSWRDITVPDLIYNIKKLQDLRPNVPAQHFAKSIVRILWGEGGFNLQCATLAPNFGLPIFKDLS